jgi:hypothetical protein
MLNIKSLSVFGMGIALLAGLTACATWERDSDRTAGRVVDDRKITGYVEDELNREPTFKFDDVDVKTFAGVVQLSGFVNTEEQKQRAGQIAQNTPGVTQVINSIALKPHQAPSPTGRTSTGYLDRDRDQIPAPYPSTTTTNQVHRPQ